MEFLELRWDTKKYEIDPIFASQELFEDLRTKTHDWYAVQVNEAIAFREPEFIIARERELVERILRSSFSAPSGIFRAESLNNIDDQIDILFSVSVVSTLSSPIEFLQEAQQKLSQDWVICIVEPMLNESDNFSYFLRRNTSTVKWVTVRKNKDIWYAVVKIESKALKRVITISKRFKKAQN